MPLYLHLFNLLKIEYSYVHNLDKEYKYSLGEDAINLSWKLLDLFVQAQTLSLGDEEKKKVISQISLILEVLKLRIRFLTELKQLSLRQTANINRELVEIGKMIGSWQKNV